MAQLWLCTFLRKGAFAYPTVCTSNHERVTAHMTNNYDPARPAPQDPLSAGLTLFAGAAQCAQICDNLGIAPAPSAFMLLAVGMAYGAAAVLATLPHSWR